jgi:DNA-binding CsgD family transcriptional regulator
MEAIRSIEFFSFEDEVWYRAADGTQKKLSESDPVVRGVFDYLSEFHPEALSALEEKYARFSPNIVHYRYRVARRFCKCNFGAIDHVPDVCSEGRMHFEHISCPLRGECPLEGIVCHPKFNSKISTAEMRVLELVHKHVRCDEIAERLCLSLHTLKNHKRNAYNRIGVQNTAEFIAYANAHNLFNVE